MTAARPQRMVSVVTLTATAVVVLVMAIWGFNALTAPIPDDSVAAPVAANDNTQACPEGQTGTIVDFVARGEVTVSVYNAGKKAGRARSTLDKLEFAGFQAGAIGNAPDGTKVQRAEVFATSADATKAKLVALALGKGTPVTIAGNEEDLGPGVNVFIGDSFHKLDRAAPGRLRLPKSRVDCN